jgi:hypothetical protein
MYFEIPNGDYCYEIISIDKETGKINIKTCPYWHRAHNRRYQENGYCSFLNIGDWEESGLGLLWDMVKECGINVDYEEPD